MVGGLCKVAALNEEYLTKPLIPARSGRYVLPKAVLYSHLLSVVLNKIDGESKTQDDTDLYNCFEAEGSGIDESC